MKKFVILSLILAMGFALVLATPLFAEEDGANAVPTLYSENGQQNQNANGEVKKELRDNTLVSGLEKILSPDLIKYFEKIVKQGNNLYGVKRASSTVNTTATGTEPTQMGDKKIEKILTPADIHLFEQIKKIGVSLWGVKKEDVKKEDVKKPEPKPEDIKKGYIKSEAAACVIAAIKTKDSALKDANTYQANAINEAVSARTICQENVLNAAVSATASTTVEIAKQQRGAFNGCVETFKKAGEGVREAAKKNHDAVWATYKTSMKACYPESTDIIPMVEDGGGNVFGSLE